MNRLIAVTLLGGLALAGCCMPPKMDAFSRMDETESRPWGYCGIFSGYGTTEEPERLSAVYTPISVSEYGDLLCGHLAPEDYASCVNRIWDHYRQANREPSEPGDSSSGPFAVVVWGEVFLGSYWSDPFSASFSVSNGRLACRGSYNAFFGDKEAVFDVLCDNGKHGKAQMVRDRSGRNGIGRVYMDDGIVGKVVFGHATVGGALETSGI
jgi:hypothetical protein